MEGSNKAMYLGDKGGRYRIVPDEGAAFVFESMRLEEDISDSIADVIEQINRETGTPLFHLQRRGEAVKVIGDSPELAALRAELEQLKAQNAHLIKLLTPVKEDEEDAFDEDSPQQALIEDKPKKKKAKKTKK